MILQEIYNLVNYILGKELTGNGFTLPQFNLVIKSTESEMKSEDVDALLKLKIQGDPRALSLFVNKSMIKPFFKEVPVNLSDDGTASLPTDFERELSVSNQSFNDPKRGVGVSVPIRIVEMVEGEEFTRRSQSVAYRHVLHPFGRYVNSGMEFVPYNLGLVNFMYIRQSKIPYQDYCQNVSTLDTIFMPQGSKIILDDSNNPELVASDGTVLADPVVTTATAFPYLSKTQELEFETWTHFKFISRILSKSSMSIGEDKITQYAELLKKEDR